MPTFSFVILTYNSAKHIQNFLESLFEKYKEKIQNGEYEVVIVDNNSSDNTVEIIEKNFSKGVSLFKNPQNSGFATGINLGAKIAKSQYLLFINPDTELKSGDVADLIAIFKEKEKVAVVGGKMLTWDGKEEASAGKFYTFTNTLFLSLGLEEIFGVRFSPEKICKVPFVSGGCMAVSKNIFEKLGGFDENFFMYIEDMEFCYRAKKAEYSVFFCPSFVIRHAGQGSSDRSFAVVNIYKGLLYFHKKQMGYLSFILVKLLLKTKAIILVILGKLMNNKYLSNTYLKALKV